MAPPKAVRPPPRPNPLKNRPPVKAPPPINRQRSATPGLRKPKVPTCPNKTCNSTSLEEGTCTECGTVLYENNIVSEVQFGETSSGAAMVQGTYVGADQGGATGIGIGGRGDGQNNRAKTLGEGRTVMSNMAAQLMINPSIVDAGNQIFKMAANANFIQGRRLDMVAVVCLYSACRKSRPCRVMLIDFADKLGINVFKLGVIFKALHKAIPMSADGLMPILPEDLIHRFAQKLEFGDLCDKVAEDAVRMVKRMSLDWMVMGRRPSGVCGACLIMAARMNNFRRTVTELVYIVKVTTNTIQKRLEEFKLTPSSALTVEEFLHNEFLESAHDPPSFYEQTEEFQKTKKKRKRKAVMFNDADGSDSDEESPDKRQKTTTPAPELRRDADGFAIPPIPNQRSNTPSALVDPESNIDPALRSTTPTSQTQADHTSLSQTNTGTSQNTLGTSVGLGTPPPTQPGTTSAPTVQTTNVQSPQAQSTMTPPPTQSTQPETSGDGEVPVIPRNVVDKETGNSLMQLAKEIGEAVGEGVEEDEEMEETTPAKRPRGPDRRPIQVDEEWANAELELETEISEIINDPNTIDHAERYAVAKQRATAHMIIAARTNPQKEVSMDVHIGEDEFKDDPEVLNCLLSAEDAAHKEKLWVNENKQWLRKQQIREWERRAAENGPPKAKRNRQKKPRMGENQTSAASTPVEATQEAFKRHTYSKKVNYDAIASLFDPANLGLGSAATSRVTSQAGSDIGSDSGSRASSVAPLGSAEKDLNDNALSLFPLPQYLSGKRNRSRGTKKTPSVSGRSTPRASPAPRPILPRPSAEPESVRSTPAPSEPDPEEDEDMDEESFGYVKPTKESERQEEVVEDWRAALKQPRAEGQEEEFEDTGEYDDLGGLEPGGLGDFDDENADDDTGMGYDDEDVPEDDDMADYQ